MLCYARLYTHTRHLCQHKKRPKMPAESQVGSWNLVTGTYTLYHPFT